MEYDPGLEDDHVKNRGPVGRKAREMLLSRMMHGTLSLICSVLRGLYTGA